LSNSPITADVRGLGVDLTALSPWAREIASTFISIASDIALVIDRNGVVSSAVAADATLAASTSDWVGRPWAETVSNETRRKIDLLLQEVRGGGATRRREVNHRFAGGIDIPISYCAIQLGLDGPVLAVGRDLRSVAAIQQRFLDTQQEMEKSYWTRRRLESRYRALFEVLSDTVLVIDANNLMIVDADESAVELFGAPKDQLIGTSLSNLVDAGFRPSVEELLLITRSTGKASEIKTRLASSRSMVRLCSAPFRASHTPDAPLLILVRARYVEKSAGGASLDERIEEIVDRSSMAVVITDGAGRIICANSAFVDLCAARGESQLVGLALEQAIKDGHRSIATVIDSVRNRGMKSGHRIQFGNSAATSLVSAALLTDDGDQERIGFVFRQLPHTSNQLFSTHDHLMSEIAARIAQFGKLPLPELVRSVAEIAEQQLLRHALERCAGDRDAAAAMLGISTENLSLYAMRHDLEVIQHEVRADWEGAPVTRH
jgi:transcriptional regulator PpsR